MPSDTRAHGGPPMTMGEIVEDDFDGLIDGDVWVWNRLLTEEDIKFLTAGGDPRSIFWHKGAAEHTKR